jgi:hypothetical protein
LLLSAYDGTVRQWRLRLDDLIQAACASVGRLLTPAEVEQYLGSTPAAALCTTPGK